MRKDSRLTPGFSGLRPVHLLPLPSKAYAGSTCEGSSAGSSSEMAGPLAPLPYMSPSPRLPEGEQVPAQLSCLWERFRPGRLSSWGGGNPPEVNAPSAVKGRPQAGLERAAPSLVPSLSGCSVVLLELLRGQKSLVSPSCSPAFPSGLISHPLGAPSRPLEQPAPHPTPSLQKGCKHASPKVTSQRPAGKCLCKFLCNAPQLVSLTYLMLRLSRIWRVRVLQTGSCF